MKSKVSEDIQPVYLPVSSPIVECCPDVFDRASLEESYATNMSINKIMEQINKEKTSIGPIFDKNKPYCRRCLRPIPMNRHKAVPHSPYCIDCANGVPLDELDIDDTQLYRGILN